MSFVGPLQPQVAIKSFPVEPIRALIADPEGSYLIGGGISGDIFFWEVRAFAIDFFFYGKTLATFGEQIVVIAAFCALCVLFRKVMVVFSCFGNFF